MTKLFLILILIGIVLIAGCTGETQTNNGVSSEQTTSTSNIIQKSVCEELASCGYLKTNSNIPPIMTGECIHATKLIQRNAPQIRGCLEESYGATWETDIARLRCAHGLASRGYCEKAGVTPTNK